MSNIVSSETKIIKSIYLHVSNSGVTLSVIDSGNGPEIQIESASFGNLNHKLNILTNKESLSKLAKMFDEASKEEYSLEYCYSAK